MAEDKETFTVKDRDGADYLAYLAENAERGSLKAIKTPSAKKKEYPKQHWAYFQEN